MYIASSSHGINAISENFQFWQWGGSESERIRIFWPDQNLEPKQLFVLYIDSQNVELQKLHTLNYAESCMKDFTGDSINQIMRGVRTPL